MMNASNMHNMAQQSGAAQPASQSSILKEIYSRFSWHWPWFAIAFCAAIIIGTTGTPQISSIVLCIFTIIAILITLKERIPEAVILAAALAAWMILRLPRQAVWQEMLAFSGLCVLLFLFQFIWEVRRPVWPAHVWPAHASALRILATGGQAGVVLVILFKYHGPLAPSFILAQVGAIGLFVLALLVLWAAYAQDKTKARYWCRYLAGLLVSATLSWESPVIWKLPQLRWLVGNTQPIEFLTMPIAIYLTTIAPFLMRKQTIQSSRYIGYICALVGPALLLGPSFVFSFHQDLLSVLLLLVESLGLFLMGNLTRPALYPFIYVGFILSVLADIRMIFYSFDHPNDLPLIIGIVSATLAIVIGITVYIFFIKKK